MKSKLTNFLSLAVVMLVLTAVFTVSAFAEISGGFGNIVGLDSAKTYEAAPATLNAAGDGLAIVTTYTAVDGTTTGLAGLYYVRESGESGNGTLVYVYGSASERQAILALEGENPKTALGTEFETETLVIDGTDPVASLTKVVNTEYQFVTYLQNYYKASDTSDTAKDKENEYLNNYRIRYSYASNEIIHTSELKSLKLRFYNHTSPFNSVYVKPRIIFHVVSLDDGSVNSYTWSYGSEVSIGGNGNWTETYTVEAATTLKGVDGYVVGIEIALWENTDVSAWGLKSTAQDFMFGARIDVGGYTISIPKEDDKILGGNARLLLDGMIGVKVELDVLEGTEAVEVTEFTSSDDAYTAPEFTVSGTKATATIYVAPKDANALELSITVVADGQPEENQKTYNVSVMTLVKAYESSDDATLKALAGALRTYIEYAENYFADPDTVPALADIELELTNVTADCVKGKDGDLTAAGLEFKSTSLILEGATTIRHYFKVVDADKFALYDTYLTKVDYADDIYYIEKENIAAHELNAGTADAAVTVTATPTEGGEALTMTLSFSAVNYVEEAFDSDNGRLVNLVKALYKYSVAADAYEAAHSAN